MGAVPVMVALILLLACTTPPGMAGCDTLRDTMKREECRFTEAKKLAATPEALDAALVGLDPTNRDLLLVRLAMDTPTSSAVLCGRVTTDIGRQRCQQILGRPHLRGQAP